jgi:hypothetical protein
VSKIKQFNSELNTADSVLDSSEVKTLENLALLIENNAIKSKFTSAHWELLSKLIFMWPKSYAFPGIDILRLVALHSEIPANDPKLFSSMGKFLELDGQTEKNLTTNLMLVFRTYSNLFAHDSQVNSVQNAILAVILFHTVSSYNYFIGFEKIRESKFEHCLCNHAFEVLCY